MPSTNSSSSVLKTANNTMSQREKGIIGASIFLGAIIICVVYGFCVNRKAIFKNIKDWFGQLWNKLEPALRSIWKVWCEVYIPTISALLLVASWVTSGVLGGLKRMKDLSLAWGPVGMLCVNTLLYFAWALFRFFRPGNEFGEEPIRAVFRFVVFLFTVIFSVVGFVLSIILQQNTCARSGEKLQLCGDYKNSTLRHEANQYQRHDHGNNCAIYIASIDLAFVAFCAWKNLYGVKKPTRQERIEGV